MMRMQRDHWACLRAERLNSDAFLRTCLLTWFWSALQPAPPILRQSRGSSPLSTALSLRAMFRPRKPLAAGRSGGCHCVFLRMRSAFPEQVTVGSLSKNPFRFCRGTPLEFGPPANNLALSFPIVWKRRLWGVREETAHCEKRRWNCLHELFIRWVFGLWSSETPMSSPDNGPHSKS
jgi:hypothetical protein